MKEYPTIQTKRLFLRPFFITDAKEVQRLAGDPKVAATLFTFNPQKNGVAEQWILDQHEHFEKGDWVNFAITGLCHGSLMGSVGLDIDRENHTSEIMYWLGKIYWGCGYATEAAAAVLQYGFWELQLYRIYARYLSNNIASGRVLQKIGMNYERHIRQHIKDDNLYEDLDVMGLVREEYNIKK